MLLVWFVEFFVLFSFFRDTERERTGGCAGKEVGRNLEELEREKEHDQIYCMKKFKNTVKINLDR